jgi:hypothetical protein
MVSIFDEVTAFINLHNISSRTMYLRFTQLLTEMSTSNIPRGGGVSAKHNRGVD